ncbi:histidine N-alpha-methyltransferase-like [Branchiostoma floridae x Branchiostoma japonicum]
MLDADNVDSFDFSNCDIALDLIPVVEGLTKERKRLPFWHGWDDKGSEIFEIIATTSPTYTLWKRELALLEMKSNEIASETTPPTILVELGSGASSKTRLIIEAMLKNHGSLTFVPVDLAKDMITKVGKELEQSYPGLKVEPFGGIFMDGIRNLSNREENKLLLFLGSSFSNVCMYEQVNMMKEIRAQLTAKDRFLMGLDMDNDRASLLEAYNDQWDFDGDMDKTKFEYVYDFVEKPADGEVPSYVVGYLKSLVEHSVNFRKLGLTVYFQAGEKIYFTDGPNHSSKWNPHQIHRLAERSGFAVENYWTNEASDYCLVCFVPV